MAGELTIIGETNFRGIKKKFGIKEADRRQHMYVIGKTGTGKTQFLKNMAMQDINNGKGLAIVDPHGEFVEEILESIPPHRIDDVVYFNPADMEYPVSFNIMEVSDPRYKHLIASGLIGIFTKIWANVWSARMEYILANCILALLDTPGTTLLGVPRILVDKDYRQKIINNLQDPVVKSFWVNEYEEWEARYRNEAIAPIQNKVGQFLNVSFIRNIVGQPKNTINIDEIMNNQKILLVNVSKGRIGEDNSAILGAMVITKIQLAAMERVRIPEEERKDFYLYVDEFQNFATESFVNILSEARKYRLNLIVAHQYIGQLVTQTSTAVRDAIFGNIGTMVCFRVGAADAEFLEQEFSPEFEQNDLIHLPNRHIYIKLMIDGITSRPFSAKTITIPPVIRDNKKREKIINISRSKYARPKVVVEKEINRWASSLEMVDFEELRSSKTTHSTKLYTVKCSNCGKDTKVIFEPSPDKPVYCKSCLKKIKRGEISDTAPEKSSISQRGVEGEAVGVSISQKEKAGEELEEAAALAGLGIEFAPPPKIETIPFHSRRSKEKLSSLQNKNGDNSKTKGIKKKEINLSELRKILEESLSKKEEKQENGAKLDPEEELKKRIEEEKYEDRLTSPSS